MVVAAGAGFAGDGWLPITLTIVAMVIAGAATIYFKNVRGKKPSDDERGRS